MAALGKRIADYIEIQGGDRPDRPDYRPDLTNVGFDVLGEQFGKASLELQALVLWQANQLRSKLKEYKQLKADIDLGVLQRRIGEERAAQALESATKFVGPEDEQPVYSHRTYVDTSPPEEQLTYAREDIKTMWSTMRDAQIVRAFKTFADDAVKQAKSKLDAQGNPEKKSRQQVKFDQMQEAIEEAKSALQAKKTALVEGLKSDVEAEIGVKKTKRR